MKVKNVSEFVPFTITIETLREAQVLLSTLIIGEYNMRTFNICDKTMVKDFIYHLRTRGIDEI